jgi:hypothetical protein
MSLWLTGYILHLLADEAEVRRRRPVLDRRDRPDLLTWGAYIFFYHLLRILFLPIRLALRLVKLA